MRGKKKKRKRRKKWWENREKFQRPWNTERSLKERKKKKKDRWKQRLKDRERKQESKDEGHCGRVPAGLRCQHGGHHCWWTTSHAYCSGFVCCKISKSIVFGATQWPLTDIVVSYRYSGLSQIHSGFSQYITYEYKWFIYAHTHTYIYTENHFEKEEKSKQKRKAVPFWKHVGARPQGITEGVAGVMAVQHVEILPARWNRAPTMSPRLQQEQSYSSWEWEIACW